MMLQLWFSWHWCFLLWVVSVRLSMLQRMQLRNMNDTSLAGVGCTNVQSWWPLYRLGIEVLASEPCQVQQLQDKLAEMQALFGMGALIGGAFKGASLRNAECWWLILVLMEWHHQGMNMTELTNLYYMGLIRPRPRSFWIAPVRRLLLSWQAQSSSSDAAVEQQRQEIEHLRTEVVQVLLFLSHAQWPNSTGVHKYTIYVYICTKSKIVLHCGFW